MAVNKSLDLSRSLGDKVELDNLDSSDDEDDTEANKENIQVRKGYLDSFIIVYLCRLCLILRLLYSRIVLSKVKSVPSLPHTEVWVRRGKYHHMNAMSEKVSET